MNKNVLKNVIKISVYFALINVTIGVLYGNNTNDNSSSESRNDNSNKTNNNEYCDKELCPKGNHIACNNDGALSSRCPSDTEIVNFEKAQQDLIVHLHNKYRSRVASGQLPPREPATRMATMVWDDELAKLAELNVKKCSFEYDECLNTKRFRNAGQSLTIEQFYKSDGLDLNKLITDSVNSLPYVDFLQFVLDRNTHVGCAAIRFTDPTEIYPTGSVKVTVACNYASVTIEKLLNSFKLKLSYETGNSASKCTTGENPNYPGLCSLKERINPNYNHDFDF